MPEQTIETKVRRLEQRVTRLEELPTRMDRLESQIVQFRTEMRAEFSAVREEAGRTITTLRDDIRAGDSGVIATLRDEIKAGDERVIATLGEGIEGARREARLLFEEVISRIVILGEGRAGNARKRKAPKI